MKKIKGLLLAAIIMLSAGGLKAQTYSEAAAMFSRTRTAGTARILGMGGAQVSLGGDMSSSWSNPAGLGMFNRSEFSFTPQYYSFQNNNGTYYSGSTPLSEGNKDSRTGINIPALGIVFSTPKREEGFLQGTFAITMTKVNDFNRNLSYSSGVPNPNTSLIDYFLDNANGYNPSEFGSNGALANTVTQLAYDNYLIGESTIAGGTDPTQYFTDVSGTPYQNENVQTKGAQNQWNLSYGANFNDKFFLGGSLGIVGLNYQSKKVYWETFNDDGPLNDFTLSEDLQIRGTGINLTVGGIVRPVGGLQLGAAITTPTRYNITDTYSASMQSSWKNFDYYNDGSKFLNNESSQTDVATSTYNLNTPWKFAFGASYIFGKVGLISLDVERLNYGAARYHSQTAGVSNDYDNQEISKNYTARTNVRLGGEVRVKDFRFRTGFGVMPDISSSKYNNVSNTWSTASLGVGYRKSNFYIDLAYVQTFVNGNLNTDKGNFSYSTSGNNKGNLYIPYTTPNGPSLLYDQKATNVIATVGFIF